MVKPQRLDMREADGYVLTEVDIIIKKLKSLGKYTPNLLYRGFHGDKLGLMLKTGTDRGDSNKTNCCTEEELKGGGDLITCALEFVNRYENPALAVYDGKKIEDTASCMEREFLDPSNKLEALVAVFLLEY